MSNSKTTATNNRTAIVNMEEEYMRLQIDYIEPEDRTEICANIDSIEKELDLYPEVIHKRNENGGTYFVEFDKDIYLSSRIAGDFIEKLLKALSIEHCEES